MVQAFTPHGADEALRKRILPRTAGGREHFEDPHALHSLPEGVAVDAVTIAEKVGWRTVVREGLHELAGGPGRGGMLGHVDVDDAPPTVGEYDEDEEDTQARSGDCEEIEGDQSPDVVGEERPPALGRRGLPLREEPGDGPLGYLDPQLLQLAMDSGRAPERIGCGHVDDKGLDLGVDGWPAPGGPAGELGPVLAEALTLPPHHGVWRHDHEGRSPPGPEPGQPNPQKAIRPAQPGPQDRSLIHGKLVAQGEVLQSQLAVAAAEEREESEQVEEDGDHRAEIVSGSEPIDQSLPAGRSFGEGQGLDPKHGFTSCGRNRTATGRQGELAVPR
jgi:hypothetical protein